MNIILKKKKKYFVMYSIHYSLIVIDKIKQNIIYNS